MDSNSNFLVSVGLAAGTLAAVGFYCYLRHAYSYWHRKGLDGPRPVWPLGNFHKFLTKNKIKTQRSWAEQYGKMYGLYVGTEPQLVLNDPELFNQVCIKDFDSFTDHSSDVFFDEYQRSFIFFVKGDHWKKMRALMSPTFTSGKIKRMFRFLDTCAQDLVALFGEQFGESAEKSAIVNVKDLYCLYTMDAITNCCYGIKLERDSSVKSIKTAASRNLFVELALRVFQVSVWRSFFILIAPTFILKALNFKRTPNGLMLPMRAHVERIIEQRKRHPEGHFDDYLQMLIDARLEDKLDYDEQNDSNENHHAGLTGESLRQDQDKILNDLRGKVGREANLSDFEIVTAGMFLIFVGVETTATLLTQATYILAFHQEHQKRLYEEVSKVATGRDSFDYEALTACPFLDGVLAETLRLFPPFPLLNRVATRDYTFEGYNLSIAKGTVVNLSIASVMMSPEYFEQPQKFDPARFLPGRKELIKAGAYMPFGVGPRHCIGMRFSLTEAKLALAKLLMNFEFRPAPGASFPPEPIANPFLNSVNKAPVEIVARGNFPLNSPERA